MRVGIKSVLLSGFVVACLSACAGNSSPEQVRVEPLPGNPTTPITPIQNPPVEPGSPTVSPVVPPTPTSVTVEGPSTSTPAPVEFLDQIQLKLAGIAQHPVAGPICGEIIPQIGQLVSENGPFLLSLSEAEKSQLIQMLTIREGSVQFREVFQAYELLNNWIAQAIERAEVQERERFRNRLVERLVPALEEDLLDVLEYLQVEPEEGPVPPSIANTFEQVRKLAVATVIRSPLERLEEQYSSDDSSGNVLRRHWELCKQFVIDVYLDHLRDGQILQGEMRQWQVEYQMQRQDGQLDGPELQRINEELLEVAKLRFGRIFETYLGRVDKAVELRRRISQLTSQPASAYDSKTHAQLTRLFESEYRRQTEMLQPIAHALQVEVDEIRGVAEAEILNRLRVRLVSLAPEFRGQERLQSMSRDELVRRIRYLQS